MLLFGEILGFLSEQYHIKDKVKLFGRHTPIFIIQCLESSAVSHMIASELAIIIKLTNFTAYHRGAKHIPNFPPSTQKPR